MNQSAIIKLEGNWKQRGRWKKRFCSSDMSSVKVLDLFQAVCILDWLSMCPGIRPTLSTSWWPSISRALPRLGPSKCGIIWFSHWCWLHNSMTYIYIIQRCQLTLQMFPHVLAGEVLCFGILILVSVGKLLLKHHSLKSVIFNVLFAPFKCRKKRNMLQVTV